LQIQSVAVQVDVRHRAVSRLLVCCCTKSKEGAKSRQGGNLGRRRTVVDTLVSSGGYTGADWTQNSFSWFNHSPNHHEVRRSSKSFGVRRGTAARSLSCLVVAWLIGSTSRAVLMGDTRRAQFLEAIDDFYGHTSSAEERSAAENWLTQLKDSQEAWQVKMFVRA
jgi:hypothetical protein